MPVGLGPQLVPSSDRLNARWPLLEPFGRANVGAFTFVVMHPSLTPAGGTASNDTIVWRGLPLTLKTAG